MSAAIRCVLARVLDRVATVLGDASTSVAHVAWQLRGTERDAERRRQWHSQ